MMIDPIAPLNIQHSLLHKILIVLVFVELSSGSLFLFKVNIGLLISFLLLSLIITALILSNFNIGLDILVFSILLGHLKLPFLDNPLPIFYTDLVFLIVFSLLLVQTIHLKSFAISFSSTIVFKVLIIFILYCGLFLLISIDPKGGLMSLRYVLGGLLTLILLEKIVDNKQQIKDHLYALIFCGLALSFLVFFATFFEGSSYIDQYKKGTYLGWGRSNYLASFLVVLIPITLSIVLSKTEPFIKRLYALFSAFLMFWALLLTGSRGGVLAFGAVLVILSARFLRLRTLTYVILFFLIFVYLSTINPATSFIFEGITNFDKQGSVMTRVINWTYAWKTFKSHALLGIGFGNLGHYIVNPFEQESSAHNIILKLLSETGMIGFVLFSIVVFTILKTQVKNCLNIRDKFYNSASWGMLAGTSGLLLHSLIEPSLWGYQMQILFWMVTGLSLKLSTYSYESKEREQAPA